LRQTKNYSPYQHYPGWEKIPDTEVKTLKSKQHHREIQWCCFIF